MTAQIAGTLGDDSDFHDPCAHLCNRLHGHWFDPIHTFQLRRDRRARVHLCNCISLQSSVTNALLPAISLAVFGIGLPIPSPVIGIPCAPGLLRFLLIFLIVGIIPPLFLLPAPSALSLAGRATAVGLLWGLSARAEQLAASCTSRLLHPTSPCLKSAWKLHSAVDTVGTPCGARSLERECASYFCLSAYLKAALRRGMVKAWSVPSFGTGPYMGANGTANHSSV